MKLYTQIAISLLCLISLLSGQVVGQDNYVLLSDVSGVDRSYYEEELEVKATEVINSLNEIDVEIGTTISSNFKVFDFDLYLHNNVTEDGISNGVNQAIQLAESQSKYYILFIKISSAEGVYSQIQTIIELPSLNADCSSNDNILSIQEMMTATINNELIFNGQNIEELFTNAMNTFQDLTDYLYVCCGSSGFTNGNKKSNSDCRYSSFDELKFVLFHNKLAEIDSINFFFQQIETFVNRMDQCFAENWMTYPQLFNSFSCAGEKGFVPVCLIEADQIQDQSIQNIKRFRPGVADGIYSAVVELPQVITDLVKLLENAEKVKDAFTWALLRCNSRIYSMSIEACDDYYNNISQLDTNSEANNAIAQLLDRLKLEEGYYEKLNDYISDCDEAQEIRTSIIKFVTDIDKMMQLFNSISASIDQYVDSFDGPARYYCVGRIVGDIVLGVIGDKGASKAAKALEKFGDIQKVIKPLYNRENRSDFYDDLQDLSDHPNFNKISEDMFDDFMGNKNRLDGFMKNKTQRDLYETFKETITCN